MGCRTLFLDPIRVPSCPFVVPSKLSHCLLIRLLDKIGGHPEQAPRGRRRRGAPSKDPVPRSVGLQTCGIRRTENAALESYATRPRRNCAQHDLGFESKPSHQPPPGKLSGNRISMVKVAVNNFNRKRLCAAANRRGGHTRCWVFVVSSGEGKQVNTRVMRWASTSTVRDWTRL